MQALFAVETKGNEVIVHQVLFRFNSGFDWDSPEVQAAERLSIDHPKNISQIKMWHCGRKMGARPDAADFSVIGYFDSLEDLAAYADHPDHRAGVAAWREVSTWVVSDVDVSTVPRMSPPVETDGSMAFDPSQHKAVVLIADDLMLGLAMNALSVIGVSIGRRVRGIVGPDVLSGDEIRYPGVINTPLPILKASPDRLDAMFRAVRSDPRFVATPFSRLAQSCKTYDEYGNRMASQPSDDLALSGLGLIGPKKDINKMTGSMALYR